MSPVMTLHTDTGCLLCMNTYSEPLLGSETKQAHPEPTIQCVQGFSSTRFLNIFLFYTLYLNLNSYNVKLSSPLALSCSFNMYWMCCKRNTAVHINNHKIFWSAKFYFNIFLWFVSFFTASLKFGRSATQQSDVFLNFKAYSSNHLCKKVCINVVWAVLQTTFHYMQSDTYFLNKHSCLCHLCENPFPF